MEKKTDDNLFDIRTQQHHRAGKQLDDAALGKYLKSLPDSSDNIHYIDISLEAKNPTLAATRQEKDSSLTFQPADADDAD